MTRGQAQLVRLLLMCVAWALGQTLTQGLRVELASTVLSAALAIGVYVLTEDLGRPRAGGDGKYWRGRRIEDDRRDGGRWN